MSWKKKIEITKTFEFDSAHKLDWYKGKCSNLHGHRWTLSVTVEGKLNKNGIVMDFGDLKKLVNEEIIEKLDHKYLNLIFLNPTAENIALKIFDVISKKVPKGVKLVEVSLWEQPTSKVTIRK
jgi:6-pyruvoyltetrahydropterin/6-carboxytetrahydropterin synthase